jgi:hypothetical protein
MMQRYMPTFFQAADASEKWAGMKEDSEDGDWYHREDVDARITELEKAMQEIAQFKPGTFWSLRDEIKIYETACYALMERSSND